MTEIAAELGVHKSTASRLVSVLESRGFVEQLSDRGKYRLGYGIARLGSALTRHRDLAHEGRVACEALAADTGETVNLAILDGDRVINISEVRGSGTVAVQTWVGQSTPSHATSSGKVLLAYLTPARRAEVLAAGGTARFTPRTLSGDALEGELERVRASGYALAVEEYEVGLNATAAPVFDRSGKVVAALSLSGPTYRLSKEQLARMVAPVMAGAAEISRRMGFFAD